MKEKDIQKNIIIKQILSNNPQLKGSTFQKINVGFTNEIYEVDEKYIIKICVNKANEKNFLKEISFYEQNKNCSFIPQLLAYDTSFKIVPYMMKL